ncbi:MAG: hypothetical protein M0Z67_05660 [Nitrospiraceae bacterium]|nr:hypothetical protein [Nitrospiraceae bacterium]
MIKILKIPVWFVLKIMGLSTLVSLKREGPLKDYGWFRSVKEEASVDAEGMPLPWLTYPAIEFLRNRLDPGMSVCEYGCGNGTLWWASKVKAVVSIEHDKEWYKKINAVKPGNVILFHCDLEYGGVYSRKISEFENRFDIVVIDGRDRVNCAKNSLCALKPGGVIVWDNSDRPQYEGGYTYLREKGFRKIEFVGMGPGINTKNETAIFYRDNNILGI